MADEQKMARLAASFRRSKLRTGHIRQNAAILFAVALLIQGSGVDAKLLGTAEIDCVEEVAAIWQKHRMR